MLYWCEVKPTEIKQTTFLTGRNGKQKDITSNLTMLNPCEWIYIL